MLTDVSDVGAPMNAPLRATFEAGQTLDRFTFRSLESAFVFVLGVVVGGVRSILERTDQDGAADLINDLIIHGLIGFGLSRIDAEILSASARDEAHPATATATG